MRILRALRLPASEAQITLALALSLLIMSLMLCGLLWQSNLITYQRDLIRWMWNWKYSG
jgi:hypothetical protein